MRIEYDTTYTLSQVVALMDLPIMAHPNETQRYPASIDQTGDHSWDLSAGFEGAREMLKSGWNDHPDLSPLAITGIKTERSDVTWSRDVTGEEVDIGCFLAGESDCYLEPRIEVVPGDSPIVWIVVNCAVSWQVSGDDISRRGLAVMGLIEALEATGKSVGLIALASQHGGNHSDLSCTRVVIKEPFERVITERVFFALAHPAFNRRIIFRLREMGDKDEQRKYGIGSNYGVPLDIPETDIPHGSVYVPILKSGGPFSTSELARDWLKSELLKQNVTFAD